MSDYGRRIVLNLGFEEALGEARRAVREEGLEVIARIDLRAHFWSELARDFRQYLVFELWSPETAYEALCQDLDVGTILPTTVAVYELADGETAMVAREPLRELAASAEWRREAPGLALLADRETERIARAFDRIAHAARSRTPVSTPA